MANEKNLERGKTTQFRTGEEQARIAQMGGIASGAARRKKKALKEAVELYFSLPVTDKRTIGKLRRKGLEPEDMDNQMAMVCGLHAQATAGDARAAKVLVDILGEKNGGDSTEGVQIIDDL